MSANLGSRPVVSVGGTALSDEYSAALIDVVIDDHLHLPDMFALHFHDPKRELIKKAGLDFGATITITATRTAGDGSQEPLLVGEITAIEADLTAHGGSTTVVRGYDASHRLSRGRRTATYRNTTDSAIAQKLASAAGLTVGHIEPSAEVHDHVGQVNVSDWDFLHSRAQLSGFEVAVSGGKFYWRKPVQASTGPSSADGETATQRLQLVLGESLISFRPRISSSAQVTEVAVRGWDPATKAAVVGTAPAGASHAGVGVAPDQLTKSFGSSTHTIVTGGPTTSDQATAAAKAAAHHVGSTAVEAEGVAVGDPHLKAGTAVSVGKVGWPYDGKYTLSSTRHVYGRDGYQTHFVVSGSQERSLLGLTSMGATTGTTGKSGASYYGVAVGIVSDNNDPENQGRVKLTLPWLSDDYDTGWARVTQLGAGSNRGATFLPEVGDEVLVAFEHGDPQTPFVIGQLYNGVDGPANATTAVSGGKVAQRQLVSRVGHRLLLDEDKGVTLEVANQQATLSFASGDGKVTLKANGDIEITGKGNIKITSTGDLELSATGNLKLSASQGVTVSAGTQLKMSASGQASLDGGAELAISGALVKIN